MTPDGILIIDRAPGVEGLVLAVGRLRPVLHAHNCFRYDRDFYAAKKEVLK